MHVRRGLAIAALVIVVAAFVTIGVVAATVAARQVTDHDRRQSPSPVTTSPTPTPARP